MQGFAVGLGCFKVGTYITQTATTGPVFSGSQASMTYGLPQGQQFLLLSHLARRHPTRHLLRGTPVADVAAAAAAAAAASLAAPAGIDRVDRLDRRPRSVPAAHAAAGPAGVAAAAGTGPDVFWNEACKVESMMLLDVAFGRATLRL